MSFGENGTENYLVFQPMHRYFKTIAGVGNDSKGLSDRLSEEKINSIETFNHSINHRFLWYPNKSRI